MATNNAIDLKQAGVASYDGAGVFAGRTITGTTNQIAVTNGSGIAGNPILALSPIVINATQPCVSAVKSSTTNNQTGNGTVASFICDSVIFDQGSNYNSGTGTFTAPVTGKYFVVAQVVFTNVGTAAYQFEIYINSTARKWTGSNDGPVNSAANTTRWAQIAAIIDMSATDTFTLSAMSTGQGANTIGIFGQVASAPITYFSCCLLC